jgi:hypothetical protein
VVQLDPRLLVGDVFAVLVLEVILTIGLAADLV